MSLLREAVDAAGIDRVPSSDVTPSDAHARASRDATDWINAFGTAWRDADAQAARELFSGDATYWWGPFDRIEGRDAIVDRWRSAVDRQQQLRFDFGVLAIEGDTTIAHWHALLDQDDACVELNGIMCVTLDVDGRCTTFREWWDRRELPPRDED